MAQRIANEAGASVSLFFFFRRNGKNQFRRIVAHCDQLNSSGTLGQCFRTRIDDRLRSNRRAARGIDAVHGLLLEDLIRRLRDRRIELFLDVFGHRHFFDAMIGNADFDFDGPAISDARSSIGAVCDIRHVQLFSARVTPSILSFASP